jgi:hypothetical protein
VRCSYQGATWSVGVDASLDVVAGAESTVDVCRSFRVTAPAAGTSTVKCMDTQIDCQMAWLEPWLAPPFTNGMRLVLDVPANVVVDRLGDVPDSGAFDGLPSPLRLGSLAVAVHPEAVMRGMLIDGDRPDARLHLDTIDIPGRPTKWPLLRQVVHIFGRGERPSVIEPTTDPEYWRLWWD